MKTALQTALKNWKTTLAGLLIPGIALAAAMGWITPHTAEALGSFIVAAGLVSAKDNNVTGGTKQQ